MANLWLLVVPYRNPYNGFVNGVSKACLRSIITIGLSSLYNVTLAVSRAIPRTHYGETEPMVTIKGDFYS